MLTEKEKQKIEEEELYRAKIQNNFQPNNTKSKGLAVILALFLGGLGIHKFYLGRVGWGIIYFIFSWTGIPMVLAFIEGIIYLFMSNTAFENKYS